APELARTQQTYRTVLDIVRRGAARVPYRTPSRTVRSVGEGEIPGTSSTVLPDRRYPRRVREDTCEGIEGVASQPADGDPARSGRGVGRDGPSRRRLDGHPDPESRRAPSLRHHLWRRVGVEPHGGLGGGDRPDRRVPAPPRGALERAGVAGPAGARADRAPIVVQRG